MLIEVTQDDIDNGRRNQPSRCPIALAIQRGTGYFVSAWIGQAVIRTQLPKASIEIPLPECVNQFIAAFDNGDDTAPFSFELPYKP